jgi:hypothetical protein
MTLTVSEVLAPTCLKVTNSARPSSTLGTGASDRVALYQPPHLGHSTLHLQVRPLDPPTVRHSRPK